QHLLLTILEQALPIHHPRHAMINRILPMNLFTTNLHSPLKMNLFSHKLNLFLIAWLIYCVFCA
ncbi:MAG TPA: hypothetical protein DEA90_01875, partial [Opitutae bacterium]|nr:hypothetical protein [Opitutae bacterium]